MTSQKLKIDFPGVQTRLLPREEKVVMDCIHNAKVLSMGPRLAELESNFAKYIGVKYAVGVSSCTAALELVAMLINIGPGDEVIVPAHTFTATALPFLRAKSRLIFADIDENTFVLSAEDVKHKLSKNTKVIVPVHLYGIMAPMREICEIAAEKNITIIEDVAQAPGASIDGKKAGSWGDFACFSFHSQKNITALGEGGMIVTNDKNSYEKLLGLRKIGSRPYKKQKKYWRPAMSNIVEDVPCKIPYNFALAEPNAAAANCILARIDAINKTRFRQAKLIIDALSNFPELEFQRIPKGYKHVYHLLVARYRAEHSDRNDLIDILYAKYRIKCVVQYNPLYNYELFQRNGYCAKTCPKSDLFFDNMISFPFWSDMPPEDIDYLTTSIQKAIGYLRKGKDSKRSDNAVRLAERMQTLFPR